MGVGLQVPRETKDQLPAGPASMLTSLELCTPGHDILQEEAGGDRTETGSQEQRTPLPFPSPSYLEQEALAWVGDLLLPLPVQPGRQQGGDSHQRPQG
jgi:hypothetical protein